MCALTDRIEDRAERLFLLYMGTLRARYMSTESLRKLFEGWDGEYCLNGIPATIVKIELEYRGETVVSEWCE